MYGRKRFKRFGKRRYTRKVRTRKVAVGSSKINIVKLQKQVSGISRSLRRKAEMVQYHYGFDQDLSSDYGSFCLTNYASWSPIFGTSSDDGIDPKAYHKSSSVECRLSLENGIFTETSTIDYTIMLVSLRDEGQNVFNVSTGALSLVSTRDYTNSNLPYAMTRVNPKMFKIHRVKRITQSNMGLGLQSATAASGTMKPIIRWTWKLNPRSEIINPIGNWTALGCNRDPSKNYFIIAFNNNSGLDAEYPRFSIACVHHVQVQGA